MAGENRRTELKAKIERELHKHYDEIKQPTLLDMLAMSGIKIINKYGDDPDLLGRHLIPLSKEDSSIAGVVCVKLSAVESTRDDITEKIKKLGAEAYRIAVANDPSED